MEGREKMNEDDSADTMKILVATDIHLGYMESDPIRGNDSVTTFEEILRLAKQNNVDFILLGGDLFHRNKPTRKTMHSAITLLRKYCLGDKPVEVEFLSDQSVNFGHTPFPCVNYEDPNLNVSIPVFSIHGNHDDPTGDGSLCALDILSACGLINYFGRYTSLEKIDISPLLMQKGNTKLALFGLGAIKDERLHRMFVNKAITMLRPKENKDDWVNIFVLHQNRSKHGETSYIPEQFLADFLHLVIWGHEHECRITPTSNGVKDFLVTQPGSPIATSLSEGETIEKHVGLLLIRGNQWKLKPLPLKTVRPFKMKDIVLADTSLNIQHADISQKIADLCEEQVKSLLIETERERNGNVLQPEKPLIRLRIDCSGGYTPFNKHRFSQRFSDKVANPRDIVVFHHRREQREKESDEKLGLSQQVLDYKELALSSTSVEDMVKMFINKEKAYQLVLLTEKGLGEAVKNFVDKEEKGAIEEIVKYQINKAKSYLYRCSNSEDILEDIQKFREERKNKDVEEDDEIKKVLSQIPSLVVKDSSSDEDMMADVSASATKCAKGSQRGGAHGTNRGRGAGRSARGRGTARQNKTMESFISTSKRKRPAADYDDDTDEVVAIDESDNEEDSADLTVNESTRKPRNTQRTTNVAKSVKSRRRDVKMGVMWDDDDDDDDD